MIINIYKTTLKNPTIYILFLIAWKKWTWKPPSKTNQMVDKNLKNLVFLFL